MGAKRSLGLGVFGVGWALLALACALLAVTGASATRAVAVASASANTAVGSSGALVAQDGPAPPAAAAAAAKDKHIKYKTVETLGELPWREIEFDAAAPSKRSGHTVTAVGRKLYVFGGCYLDEVCYNDMRVFDTVKDEWADIGKLAKDNSDSISAVPSVRGRHTTTPIKTADGTKLIVFGGSSNELYRNDVFIFDVKKKAWARPLITGVLPTPRAGHAAAVWHGRLYVTGGYTPNGYTNDLAVLDTTIMSWSSPPVTGSAPSPRAGHSFTRIAVAQNMPGSARAHGPPPLPGPVGLDAEKAKAEAEKKKHHKKKDGKKKEKKEKVRMSERLVLFGGANDRGVLNDLYIFDAVLGTWSRPAITGLPPTPRHDHLAAAHKNHLWFNGGCNIRALTCYNDTVILDTDSLTWQNPMYPVKLKIPYKENVADADGTLAKITADAKAAVKKDDNRRAAKLAKQQGRKKKKGLWGRMKSAVGMKFKQQHSADHEQEEEEEELDARDEHDEQHHNEQLTSATSEHAAAPRFAEDHHGDAAAEEADDEEDDEWIEDVREEAITSATSGPRFAPTTAAIELATSATAKDDKHHATAAAANQHKRRKRKRHNPKRKVKNSVEEDPIKQLTPRGGHGGAFVTKQNALYVIGGCYLESGCSFNLLYLHVPRKLKPVTRTRPDRNEALVTNVEPATAPRASTSTIASRREAAERARASKAIHDKLKAEGKLKPKPLVVKQVEAAHVGLALIEEEETQTPTAVPQAAAEDEEFEEIEIELDDEATDAVDAEDAEDAAFLQESAAEQSQLRAHHATTTRAKHAVQHKFKLLHLANAQARAHARTRHTSQTHAKAGNANAHSATDSASDGDSHEESEAEAEAESDAAADADELDVEVDITAEARARVRTQLVDAKRTRLLEQVRAYHAAHPQRGERDLTALQREARDAAEVEATLNADLHGGIGLYSDGELQIGAKYTTEQSNKSITQNKLFLPLTITIGLLVIGCLALVFVWLWMRDRERDAEQNAQKLADDQAAATAAAAAAAAAGLDPRIAAQLENDPAARAALEKDLLAAQRAAAPAPGGSAGSPAVVVGGDERSTLLGAGDKRSA